MEKDLIDYFRVIFNIPLLLLLIITVAQFSSKVLNVLMISTDILGLIRIRVDRSFIIQVFFNVHVFKGERKQSFRNLFFL